MPGRLLRLFQPAPAQPASYKSEDEMRGKFRYWRVRQLYTTFIGYAIFYFVRKNIPLALPLMERDLGLAKADLGKILTLHDIVYGISKFLNGFLGDRCNARYFMALGLLLSAAANVAFGMNSALGVLIVCWVLNGWFQGMGFPPCARVLSHWFSPRERGTFWGLWNTSHQFGLAVILVLAGYLGEWYGWRWIFYVPAAIAAAVALLLVERLRDTPASVGLPPVEAFHGEGSSGADAARPQSTENQSLREFWRFLVRSVFSNPFIWGACISNFFIYVVRYGFVNWAPSYLQERQVSLAGAGWMMAGFELAGLVGALVAGWLTDRFFGGRRSPVCFAYMLAATACIFAFWKLPDGHPWAYALVLLTVGFLIYGPQFLVAVFTADLATRKAAATAIGMTGFFGYLSGVISGWGLGHLVDQYGWDGAFQVLIACSVLAALPWLFMWNISAEHAPQDDGPAS